MPILTLYTFWNKAMAAQRTTNALMFIYQKFGYSGIIYIDDIGCAEVGDNAVHGYNC